ncbi:MAG: hypothetical protein N3I35_08185 [Clostridia bacterium]|nr:hypothetical protein [Clostridia bacterium]
MLSIEFYSIGVFVIIFLSGCVINLLKHHYVIQLAGVSILFTYSIIRLVSFMHSSSMPNLTDLYLFLLPIFAGISACLISMVLGFWLFPTVRRKFRN